jgi:hypothetical protein
VSETVTNSCVMDFPQAWEYIRGTDKDDHHRKCSYRVSSMLCDCDVIWAEYRKHAIAALEAKLAACEWISVDERLPKVIGPYLVFREENNWPTTRYYLDDGKWQSSATVTHWMPLPNPPQP